MEAPVISISSDSSDESVVSFIPRFILIGFIPIEVFVAPEVGAAAVASPAGVLKLDTHSSLEADPSESSLPPIPVAPMVSPFLFSDDSEIRVASRSSSPTTSTLEIPTAPIPPAPSAIDIPIGRLYRTHPGRPCRALTARKSVRPLPSHRLALRYTSHHLDHFTFGSSSDHSSSDHSSVDHSPADHTSGHSTSDQSLSKHTSPDTTIVSSSSPSRFIYLPPTRTLRASEAYHRWRSAPLSTMSPTTTMHSSIPALGALVPTRANLLLPRKRFRDSYSSEDSVEEDIDAECLIMTITRSGMTPKAIEELINQRVAEALATYEANHATELVVKSESQNGDDGDNGNDRGNGNENGRGNGDRNGEGNGNRNRGGNGDGNPNRNDRVEVSFRNTVLGFRKLFQRFRNTVTGFRNTVSEIRELMKDLQCLKEGIIFHRKVDSERFLDNKLEERERMWNSIQNGPYVRLMIFDPDSAENINSTMKQILEPLSKMIEGNKKQYVADVKVMNYLLQAIPNDIYNSVDACKNAKEMWERIKRLMFGSGVTSHVRHSRLMDEFDKFAAKEGESLESVYERLTTLVNIMDRNNVRPISVSINIKFLNCLQPEWSKYVIVIRHNQTGETVSYDMLYDSLVQFEPHVLASKAKKAAKNHDPLALIAHSNASSSQSHANSSYSPQAYYVTHPSSIVDYEDEYQGDTIRTTCLASKGQDRCQEHDPLALIAHSNASSSQSHAHSSYFPQAIYRHDILHPLCDYGSDIKGRYNGYFFQKDKLTTAMMLLARAITQKFSTPTNNHLRTSSNTRNQAVIQDGRVDIQTKNAGYGGNAMKDEARSHLNNEENDFMLDTSYGEETMEELTAAVMLMAQNLTS
ncbi:hypothetical protein Tco_0178283 [Tanacetum coccineum]